MISSSDIHVPQRMNLCDSCDLRFFFPPSFREVDIYSLKGYASVAFILLAMTSGVDIHAPPGVNPSDFGNPVSQWHHHEVDIYSL